MLGGVMRVATLNVTTSSNVTSSSPSSQSSDTVVSSSCSSRLLLGDGDVTLDTVTSSSVATVDGDCCYGYQIGVRVTPTTTKEDKFRCVILPAWYCGTSQDGYDDVVNVNVNAYVTSWQAAVW